jgi:hypothetical protein
MNGLGGRRDAVVISPRHCQTTPRHKFSLLPELTITSVVAALADYRPWPRRRKPGTFSHLTFNLDYC